MRLKNNSNSRVRAEKVGRRAERLAAWWLRLQGFRILAHRLRTPVGEIDLVALRGATLVFCEVKHRAQTERLETALLAVNRRRIGRAAEHFLSRQPNLTNKAVRFDVIFLAPGSWPFHLKGAFEPSTH